VSGCGVNEQRGREGPGTDVTPGGALRLYAATCAQIARVAPADRPVHSRRPNVISALSTRFTTLPPFRVVGR
jgi:hypothetical protein